MDDENATDDEVFLEGLRFYGYHGVNTEEQALGQRVVVDVHLAADLGPAGRRAVQVLECEPSGGHDRGDRPSPVGEFVKGSRIRRQTRIGGVRSALTPKRMRISVDRSASRVGCGDRWTPRTWHGWRRAAPGRGR